MDEQHLRLERHGARMDLILARPERQNAINVAMWRALAVHAEALAADETIGVVVLRGEPPAFSSGADIAEFEQVFAGEAQAAAYNDLVQTAMACLEALPVPTIAQVTGSCIGGGCGLALACDLRFSADNARFGITPARLGLAYSLGDVKRLVDLAGPACAKDLLFSARLIDAEEALRLGLIDRMVPAAALDEVVRTYVDSLLAVSGSSQRRIKAIARLVLDGAVTETRESRRLRDAAVLDADFLEGKRAFLEKRRPRFR